MKKSLQKVSSELYHYKNGERVEGKNNEMTGDCSGLRGDCSGLTGDCSDLSGDLDGCEITKEERKNGIKIEDLIN